MITGSRRIAALAACLLAASAAPAMAETAATVRGDASATGGGVPQALGASAPAFDPLAHGREAPGIAPFAGVSPALPAVGGGPVGSIGAGARPLAR